jgi:hypothetical protein
MEAGSSVRWKVKIDEMCGGDSVRSSSLIPPDREDAIWCPCEQDSLLAWAMYTQFRTRIATQSLPIRDGVETSALKSLFELFGLARSEMLAHPGAIHTSALLDHCLNTRVRPLTARWHAKLEAGDLENLDGRYKFRDDLAKIQPDLRALAAVLGQIAGDTGATVLLKPASVETVNRPTVRGHVCYGIQNKAQHPFAVDAMNSAEQRLLRARRLANGVDVAGAEEPINDAVGLAISGGGIRSATFALGITQVLARRGVLKDVDVISTVSGGGYLGAFISSVLNDKNGDVGLQPDQLPFAGSAIEAPVVRHLRNHSKYLAEGGLTTLARLVFAAAYGVVMALLLVAPAFMFFATTSVEVLRVLGPAFKESSWFQSLLVGVWGFFLASVVALSLLRRPSRKGRGIVEASAVVSLGVGVLLVLFAQAPAVMAAARGQAAYWLLGVLAFTSLLGAVALWGRLETALSRVALSLMVLFGPAYFFSFWLLMVDGARWMFELGELVPWMATAVLFLYGWLGVNINFASLHLYYRDRLAATYLRRVGEAGSVDPQPLSTMNRFDKAPLHLINAAVNLPGSKNVELRGRDADNFVFATHYCGAPAVGYWPTQAWEAADKHLDLATAIAISGAAAAPRMGRLTSSRYSVLLSMLNVRLGYWLRKPTTARWFDKVPGALYFIREIVGTIHEKLPFMNLSDGGHIENMGIYELFRRRCRFIVLIDGEADPLHSFDGLLNSIQMAKIDLGVRVEPDLSSLRAGIEPFKRAHFALARIDYGNSADELPVQGLLLVLKLAMTGNESETIQQFQKANPAFPHQSTAQQLFTETQFEAYRALGEHAADAAFDPLIAGERPANVADWLRSLERNLLSAD